MSLRLCSIGMSVRCGCPHVCLCACIVCVCVRVSWGCVCMCPCLWYVCKYVIYVCDVVYAFAHVCVYVEHARITCRGAGMRAICDVM